jgi:hypothetical protein
VLIAASALLVAPTILALSGGIGGVCFSQYRIA